MTEAIGEALARRTKRDPRLVLVEHLAPLRAARRAPSPLDELFVDLVVPAETTTGTSLFTAIPRAHPGWRAGGAEFDSPPDRRGSPAPNHAPIAVSVAIHPRGGGHQPIGFGASRWARVIPPDGTPPPSLAASAAPPPSAIASVEAARVRRRRRAGAPVAARSWRRRGRPAIRAPDPAETLCGATVEQVLRTVFLSCPGAPRGGRPRCQRRPRTTMASSFDPSHAWPPSRDVPHGRSSPPSP